MATPPPRSTSACSSIAATFWWTRLLEKLKRDWDKLDTHKVVKIDRTDGLKMILADGAWVLMRPSGTEPVVRVYCEAASPAERDRLAAAAQAFVQNSL